MIREIPSLSTHVLKSIAKQPSKHVTEEAVARARKITPKDHQQDFDLAQVLVDYITEAGRLVDDVLPLLLFQKQGRKTLSLKNSKISGKYIAKIINCVSSDLTDLDISGTFQVDDDVVLMVLKNCSNLVKLNIRNCRKVTDKSLAYVIAKGRNLAVLNIGGNFNLTHEGLNKFLSNYSRLSSLEELHLSGLPVQNDTLKLLSRSCASLTAVSFAYCDLGEAALRDFFELRGSNLQTLCISWLCTATVCMHEQVSAEFVTDFLVRSCPQLQELDICGLRNLSAPNVLQLLDMRLSLVESNPHEYLPFKSLRVKFIGSPKQTVEQAITVMHPYLRLEA